MKKFQNNKTIEETFIELVQIDSPSGHENAVGIYIKNWLKMHELEYKEDKVGNLYAQIGNIEKPILLLCAHMDTVEPGCGIKPIIKDCEIFSSGDTILGADNKSSLAIILSIIEELQQSKTNNSFEILFTVKEETGEGLDEFNFDWIKSDKCLIIDSAGTVGGIVQQSPFAENFEIILIGKPTHVKDFSESKSVLPTMLSSLSNLLIGTVTHQTTVNIGQISMGSAKNTVPGIAKISGEVRSFDYHEFINFMSQVKQSFQQFALKNGIQIEYKSTGFCNGYSHETNDDFIVNIHNILSKLAIKPILIKSFGASDANILNAKGIKSVNIASGVQNPHTTDESICITDMYKLKELVIKLLEELSS